MADHLLEVRHLSVEFHTVGGRVNAVQDVSWHLDKGEVLAILGESGSGKSVSASAVMDLIDCPPGQITQGEILFEGQDLLLASRKMRRTINGKRIAMIFQDPLGHLNPVYSVGWQIMETMTAHGTPRVSARDTAINLLQNVGIPDAVNAMQRYPHQFSGGQRQRLMVAMAVALKPDILIADEPTTALDVTVQAQILALLERLQEETGMGMLLITHDLGVVAEVADRVVVMNNGRIVEHGYASEVYQNPQHDYTKLLVAAVPGKGEMAMDKLESVEPLLSVKNLCKSFGNFQALKEVSLELSAGECVAIVGESGSGKSTLVKTLLQLEEATAGDAFYKGQSLFSLTPAELFKIRREIQMVFQDPTQSLNPRMSVYQLISEAWVIHKDILPRSRWRERVAELLEQVGLSADVAERYPHQFSGGQRQRIAIARALALEPEIIICDEAVSALDVHVQAQVIDLLDRLRRELGIAYLFIAHDLLVVRDFADRVVVMQNGHVVEQASVRQLFENPQQTYTQALLAASLDPDPDVQAKRRAERMI